MITKEQAMKLSRGSILHYGKCSRVIGPRGGITETIEQWRVSGRCKTWVLSPSRFRVPIKYGLYGNGYLTEADAEDFHLAGDCPLLVLKNSWDHLEGFKKG